MKRVLFLSFYFPPRNRISSYRAAGFCRHLPSFGWEPVVICEDWPDHAPDCDDELTVGLGSTEIHRIQSYGPRGLNRFLVRNVIPWILPQKTPYNWWRPAIRKAIEVCELKEFDAIFATHDPLPTLAIAAYISDRFGIPWVADLRDSWNMHRLSSPRKQRMIAKHEKRLACMADQIVTVSDEMTEELGRIFDRRVHTVSNGFDFPPTPSALRPAGKVFSILYAGTLNLKRQNPMPLLEAIQECITNGSIPRDLIHVHFLGTSPDIIRRLDSRKFPDVHLVFGRRVKRNQALSIISSASVLWVIAPRGEKGVLTGKVFDYLGSGRPILSIPNDEGEVKRLLDKTKSGFSLSSPSEINLKLVDWFDQWKRNCDFALDFDKREIRRHERKVKARQLASVLDLLH